MRQIKILIFGGSWCLAV